MVRSFSTWSNVTNILKKKIVPVIVEKRKWDCISENTKFGNKKIRSIINSNTSTCSVCKRVFWQKCTYQKKNKAKNLSRKMYPDFRQFRKKNKSHCFARDFALPWKFFIWFSGQKNKKNDGKHEWSKIWHFLLIFACFSLHLRCNV